MSLEAEIRARLPSIDPVISDYSAGYLIHASKTPAQASDGDGVEQTPLDEAVSTITSLLTSASGDLSSENAARLHQFVRGLVAALAVAEGADGERRRSLAPAKKLDRAIQVGAQRNVSSTMALAGGAVDLESTAVRKVESRVDRKKLEKAERKIQAKQDRKTMKNVEYEASRLLAAPDEAQSYEEFYMAVNPLQLGSNALGAAKSKDIKVDNVDVSIGGKRILTETSLTLAYGRRYGLVGQNGIGKSTLLRALSRREIAVPTHITILHVEQEVRLLIFHPPPTHTTHAAGATAG